MVALIQTFFMEWFYFDGRPPNITSPPVELCVCVSANHVHALIYVS